MEVSYILVTLDKNVQKYTPRKLLQGHAMHAHFVIWAKL